MSVERVDIVEYDPAWPRRFEDARADMIEACGADAFVRIEHIGSTAVPGLAAKAIIDIMPGVRSLDAFMACVPKLEVLGYRYKPEFEHDIPGVGAGMPERRYLRRDIAGKRAFHVHVVEYRSEFWTKQLRFRNWLRVFADDRDAYAALKRRLAYAYNNGAFLEGVDANVGYTDHKTAFVEEILRKYAARIAKNTHIELVPYDPVWAEQYEQARDEVARIIGNAAIAIEHVGSTSVPGLPAKPTIDIAIGMRDVSVALRYGDALAPFGYRAPRHAQANAPDWVYSSHHEPFPVHLHFVPHGGTRWEQYIDFRDYLRSHPEARDAYVALKRALAEEFGNDRLGYPEAKSDFVQSILARARAAGT